MAPITGREVVIGVIASLISGVIASWITVVYTRVVEYRSPMFIASEDDLGRVFPGAMFERVEDNYSISFKPPKLQDLVVCEFVLEKAYSWWELSIEYLQKYESCVNVRKTSDHSLEVLPNESPGSQLKEVNGRYFCKCPEDLVERTLRELR